MSVGYPLGESGYCPEATAGEVPTFITWETSDQHMSAEVNYLRILQTSLSKICDIFEIMLNLGKIYCAMVGLSLVSGLCVRNLCNEGLFYR